MEKKKYSYDYKIIYSWCKDCKKPISYSSTRCANCVGAILKRKAKARIRNRVICYLVNQKKFTLAEIGETFGVSRQAIFDLNKKHG